MIISFYCIFVGLAGCVGNYDNNVVGVQSHNTNLDNYDGKYTHYNSNIDNNDEYYINFINNHEHFYAKVVKVIDGDTVYVVAKNGTMYKLRLLGVDTPETYKKNNPYEYTTADGHYIENITYLKLWGIKAKDYAKKELSGKEVIVAFDNKAPHKGTYGRYLTYIFVNGENFNENLIKYGYARVYVSNFDLKYKFLKEEKYAKEHKIGMWNYSEK